ncbi:hypothetical protein WJX72_005776 [[Myrmecia] bisecta]|uniref:Rhodanese domain-containing protein n=1 Tax=[Myrmecia] bisecta TaxID=41462 RepID=A0AAW1R5Z6_9CHLO
MPAVAGSRLGGHLCCANALVSPSRSTQCREPLRPGRSHTKQRAARLVTLATAQTATTATRGASGLDVSGYRPTSPKAWAIVSDTLRERNVKLVAAQELLFAQEAGTPVIDIRPQPEYEAAHVPGSLNVPLYRPITGWDMRKALRRAGFAFFGVFNGTEANPNFLEEVAEVVDKDTGAVLICTVGGTLEDTEATKNGRQSRSLMAAYELIQAGYRNVNVLRGGFNDWRKSGREVNEIRND